MRIRDPGWKKFVRDDKNSDPESGMNIPDVSKNLKNGLALLITLDLDSVFR
jgi:hypothetical protein